MSGSPNPEFEQIDVPRLLQLLFIEAKKKGRAWSAICPSGLHSDRHPSWSIREEPGTRRNGKHHCFSCKFSGTAIDLTAHVLEMTLQGANDFINERALLEVHPALAIRYEIGSPIRRACTIPPGVYFGEELESWVYRARSYMESRGITSQQVDRWGLGYAVDGRLAGRVVFPTRDRNGRLLAWTARTYLNSEKRYLAASEGDNPDVDSIFGEQHWTGIKQDSILVLTEGGINALAVERVSPHYIGALSGSHLEPGHAMKLSNFPGVIILTDPDQAGDDAALKLEAMLGRHLVTERLRLQEKEDPDSVDPEYLRGLIQACSQRMAIRLDARRH